MIALLGGLHAIGSAHAIPLMQGVPPSAPTSPPAKTFTIAPSVAWDLAGESVPPGSVIELPIGVHVTAVLEGLAGSAESPIRIVSARNGEGRATAIIAGGETGVLLRRCRHVEVDGLVIIGPTRAAIRLEGCEDVTLRNLLLARLGPDAEADGIEIVDSKRIAVRSARIDGWSDAAIEVQTSQAVSLSGIELLAMDGRRNRVGLQVGAGTSDLSLERFSLRNLPLAIALGPTGSGSAGATAATGVRIEKGLVQGATVGIEFGAVSDSRIERITMRDCREPVVVLGSPREMRFVGNIVAWDPGRMNAFGRVNDDADASGLLLGENLWWSAELPAAMPLLGGIPGTATAPQRHAPSPNLDERGVANNPAVATLGRPAP
jgi:hypothetical protein